MVIGRGRYKNGKRIVLFNISSFAGICFGARHYYCSITIPLEYSDDNVTYSGFLGEDVPREYTKIYCDVCKELTEEEINKDKDRWDGYEPGDQINAFESETELRGIISGISKYFDGWEIIIK